MRPLTLPHPLGQQRPLGRIFNLEPFPRGGDTHTVGQGAVDLLDRGGDPGFVPSLRAVIDVGAWSASRFALPGGQSSNPCSPYYADPLPLWRRRSDGPGVPIAWTEPEIAAATRSTLTLLPR